MKSYNFFANFIHKTRSTGNDNSEEKTGGASMGTRGLDYAALAVVIIGAVNWGLIGFFRFDLVAFLFGNMSWISRIVYALVGLCGLYLLTFFGKLGKSQD